MIQKIQAKEAKYFEIIMKFRQPVDFYFFSVDQRFSNSLTLVYVYFTQVFSLISCLMFDKSMRRSPNINRDCWTEKGERRRE